MSRGPFDSFGAGRGVAFVLLSLLSVSALVVISVRSGVTAEEVVTVLPASSHALALVAFGLDFLCRGGRLVLLARAAGGGIGMEGALRSQLGGEAAGAVTPARAGAEPTKIWLLAGDGLSLGSIGAVLIGEILVEVAVLAAVAAAIAALDPDVGGAAGATFAYAGMGVGGAGLAVAVASLPRRDAPSLWKRLGLGEGRWRRVRAGARSFLGRLRRLQRAGPGVMAALAGLTAAHIAARLVVLPVLASGAGVDAPLGTLLAWPMLLLYGGALVPIPGAGGTVEVGFAAALGSAFTPATLAPVLVWWRVYTHYLSAALGAVVLTAAFLRRGVAAGTGRVQQ